jgi:hypothetical protein
LEEYLGLLKTIRFKSTINKLFKDDGPAIIQEAQTKAKEALNSKIPNRPIKIPILGKNKAIKGNIVITSSFKYQSFYILNFNGKLSMRPMPQTFVEYFSAKNSPSISATLSNLFATEADKFLWKMEEETQTAFSRAHPPKNISLFVDNWILVG